MKLQLFTVALIAMYSTTNAVRLSDDPPAAPAAAAPAAAAPAAAEPKVVELNGGKPQCVKLEGACQNKVSIPVTDKCCCEDDRPLPTRVQESIDFMKKQCEEFSKCNSCSQNDASPESDIDAGVEQCCGRPAIMNHVGCCPKEEDKPLPQRVVESLRQRAAYGCYGGYGGCFNGYGGCLNGCCAYGKTSDDAAKPAEAAQPADAAKPADAKPAGGAEVESESDSDSEQCLGGVPVIVNQGCDKCCEDDKPLQQKVSESIADIEKRCKACPPGPAPATQPAADAAKPADAKPAGGAEVESESDSESDSDSDSEQCLNGIPVIVNQGCDKCCEDDKPLQQKVSESIADKDRRCKDCP